MCAGTMLGAQLVLACCSNFQTTLQFFLQLQIYNLQFCRLCCWPKILLPAACSSCTKITQVAHSEIQMPSATKTGSGSAHSLRGRPQPARRRPPVQVTGATCKLTHLRSVGGMNGLTFPKTQQHRCQMKSPDQVPRRLEKCRGMID